MAEVALAFLWHQHQPYYPDDVTGENPMPWVRLHGVKDYYGMALHLLEFPEMRCTINLVPSLLRQLIAYTDEGRTDRFYDTSRVPADSLDMTILDQADPNIFPGGRNDQRLDALDNPGIANPLPVGCDVAECCPGALAADARLVVADVAQTGRPG